MNDFGIIVGFQGLAQYFASLNRWERASLESSGRVKKGAQGASDTFAELTRRMPFLGRAADLLRNPFMLLGAAIASIGIAMGMALGSAAKFNHEFLELQNINTDKTTEQIGQLRDVVLDTAMQTGIGAKEMSRAFFDIQSLTGMFGKDAEKIATDFAMFSIATKTDFNTAVEGGLKAMRAFGLEAADVPAIMASSAASVQVAKTTYDQLAKSQVEYTSAAAGSNQTLDTANKLFSAFTVTAKSVDIAANLTKTAFQDLGKKQTIEGLQMIGVSMYDANGAMKATDQVIRELSPKLRQLSDADFNKLLETIGGSEGLRGMFLQVRNEGDALLKSFDAFDAAKKNFDLNKLLENAKGDFTSLKKIVGNQLNTALAQLGMSVLPTVARGLKSFSDFIPKATAWMKEHAGTIKAAAIAVGALVAVLILAKAASMAHAAAMLVVNAATWAAQVATIAYNAAVSVGTFLLGVLRNAVLTAQVAYIALTGSTNLAAGAVKAFNVIMSSNPWGLALAAVVALGVAVYTLAGNLKETVPQIDKVAAASREVTSTFAEEGAEMNSLFNRLKQLNPASQEASALRKKLNDTYGTYLPNLITERDTVDQIGQLQRYANEQLRNSVVLKLKDKAMTEATEKSLKVQESTFEVLSKNTNRSISDVIRLRDEFLAAKDQGAAMSDELVSFLETISDQSKGVNRWLARDPRDWFTKLAEGAGLASKASAQMEDNFTKGRLTTQGAFLEMVKMQKDLGDEISKIDEIYGGFLTTVGGTSDAASGVDGLRESLDYIPGSLAALEAQISSLETQMEKETVIGTPRWFELNEQIKVASNLLEFYRAQLEGLPEIKPMDVPAPKLDTPTSMREPIDPGVMLANKDGVIELATAMEKAAERAQLMREKIAESFQGVKASIQDALVNGVGDAFYNFGVALGEGASAGDAFEQALIGLGKVILSEVPKYLGLFMLETAVGLGFPAGIPFALAGIGLLAFSGLAAGLLNKISSEQSLSGQSDSGASSAANALGSSAAAGSSGLSDFNAGDFSQNRQVVHVYMNGREISNLIRVDMNRELELAGG